MTADTSPPGVVITGGAGDMGRALSASFAQDGFTVFAGDVRPVPAGQGIVPVALDVTDRAGVFALAERAAAETRLSVWINAAGIVETAAVEAASIEDWTRIIAVNLTGCFNGCAAAFEVMRKAEPPGGRIVNIGSISGQLGGTGPHPAYGASKAGVHALTKTYALAGARHGIYCNAVAPSIVAGSMGDQFASAQIEKYLKAIPIRRLATMAEVVHAVRYLADPRASYTNGAILPVNGGQLSVG